jgi:exopolysaccharide transport family protein
MHRPVTDYRAHREIVDHPPAGAAGAIDTYSLHLREALQILRRRWWIIVLAVLAMLAAAIAFVIIVTPRYTATATVLIDPHRSSVIESDTPQAAQSNAAADDAMVGSQVSLMQSVGVLQRVVDKLGLAHDPEFTEHFNPLAPIKALFASDRELPPGQSAEDVARANAVSFLSLKRLNVVRDGSTFVIDVNATSESPEKAAKIANAVVDSYFYDQVHSKYDTRKIAASWFDRQLDELKSKVLASEQAVEKFRAANNLTVAQGVTVNDQQLADLNNKLIDAHVQTAEARAKFEQVERIAKNGADPGTLDQALSSEVIARLRTQYADVAKNLADVSSKFGPSHPQVVNARAQVRETQKLINEEVHRILDSTRQAYQIAQSREDALKKSLDSLKSISNQSSIEQVRLRELQREADANRTLYETFLARYKETNARESLNLPDSRIVSGAEIPIKPSFPKTTLILAFAVVLGTGFGGVVAFALDQADRRVKSPRHAEEATGMPTLAAIPLIGPRELSNRANRGRRDLEHYDPAAVQILPSTMQPPLMRYVLEEPTSLFAEAVRSVRLAIQRAARNGPAKTIMVTSSTDGEGKTTLAVNLALSLAALGMRTILVEGDLRNPEMSRSLCPRAKVGLVEVALGQARFGEAMLIDQASGLVVLPSPPRRKFDVSEFVSTNAMETVLGHLRDHFDCVIVDSPPLVPLVDARALADIVDRIVVTIRWDSTPRDLVNQAMTALAPDYDHVLGTVLTRVDMDRLHLYDYSSAYMTPYSYLGQPRAGRAPS